MLKKIKMRYWAKEAVDCISIKKYSILKNIVLKQTQIDLILLQKILKILSNSNNHQLVKESIFNKIDLKAFSALSKLIKDNLTESLKEALFNIILLSKSTDSINLASSNAITLLNRSEFSFSNKDLSKIKIPHADLSYGMFIDTNFESSNLDGVQFSMSNFYSSNFRNCNMIETDFGVNNLITGFKGETWFVKFSPCGRFLAIAEGLRIFLYDAKTYHKITQLIGHTSYVFYFAFSDNGNYLLSLSPYRMILWDTTSKLKIDQFMQTVYFSSFSPCNNYLCIVGDFYNSQSRSIIKIYDINSRKIINEIDVEFPKYSYLAFFSPSGKNLLILNIYFLSLWNLNSKTKINQSARHFYNRRYWDTISSNRKFIAIPLHKAEIIIYSTETLDLLIRFRKWFYHEDSLITFSPCGRYIVSASTEKDIEVYDLALRDKTFEVSRRNKCYSLQPIIFSPDGKNLININSKILKSQKIHFGEGNSKAITRKGIKMVSFSENNEYYAAACEEGWIFIFLTKNQTLIKKFQAHIGSINYISWSGTVLASLGLESIKIWDMPDGILLKTIRKNYKFWGFQFSPDGKKIIMYGKSRNLVEIWDIEKNQMITSWIAHNFGVAKSHWSPCGNFVTTCGYKEPSIKIWSADNYSLIIEHAINSRFYDYLITISNFFVFLSQNHHVESQLSKDVENYAIEIITANGHRVGNISLIVLSSNRQTFILGHGSGQIKIWDQGKRIPWIVAAHKAIVQSISLSPNGNFFISSSKDRTVKLWKFDNCTRNLR